jgi:Tripartite tricarboxylate transporter family receptor
VVLARLSFLLPRCAHGVGIDFPPAVLIAIGDGGPGETSTAIRSSRVARRADDWTRSRAGACPTRPVRLVVGFGAGSASDILARLIGEWLSERLGQQFIIENRPGSGSNHRGGRQGAPGWSRALAGRRDQRDQCDALRKAQLQFSPRHRADRGPSPLDNRPLVNPSLPARTVSEFIAYATANPGKLNMASVGNGTARCKSTLPPQLS